MAEFWITLVAIVGMLALDLLLVAARFSASQTSPGKMLALRESQETRVNRAVSLLGQPLRLRFSLNLALVFSRFALAGLLLLLIYLQPFRYPELAAALSVLAGVLALFWLEAAIEKAVLRSPEKWVIRLVSLLYVISAATNLFLIPLLRNDKEKEMMEAYSGITESDLKSLVDAGQEEGSIEQGERRMIYSVFALGDTLAREIMVPRIDMFTLDINTPLQQAVDSLIQSGHSRVPVYEETVDNLLGVLYAKDLLRIWQEGKHPESLHDLLRKAYFVPEAKQVDELLAEMQNRRIHIAIVVDEYGGVAGLVTLEDIVEELIGEIRDEYDQGEEALFQELRSGEYSFLGRIALDDFNETMGSNLPKEEADTLGGFIYSRLGRVALAGDTVEVEGLLLTVEQVSGRRIHAVRAQWKDLPQKKSEANHHADG